MYVAHPEYPAASGLISKHRENVFVAVISAVIVAIGLFAAVALPLALLGPTEVKTPKDLILGPDTGRILYAVVVIAVWACFIVMIYVANQSLTNVMNSGRALRLYLDQGKILRVEISVWQQWRRQRHTKSGLAISILYYM